MDDVSTGKYDCKYKHLVDSAEVEAQLTVDPVIIFDPAYVADTKDNRVLLLHNPDKFERLNSEIGYSYQITGANGVKKYESGELVDLSDIDISNALIFLQFYDDAGTKLTVTSDNYAFFPTFKVNVALGVYE